MSLWKEKEAGGEVGGGRVIKRDRLEERKLKMFKYGLIKRSGALLPNIIRTLHPVPRKTNSKRPEFSPV